MSRILEKPEFIRLLKEVSNKLDSNNIRNEIPFVYKDKINYDHIKILIPQETDASILVTILDNGVFNLKGQFIDFNYKDFRFIFIRTPENEFLSSFFYYSWDILPTLMNVMFNKFGLHLYPSGLKYIVGENLFLVSTNLEHIIEFLDLDSNEYFSKGFMSLFSYASFISISKYFNTQIFKDFKLNDNDFLYFDKKPQYDKVLELFCNFDKIKYQDYKYHKELDKYLLDIDTMFPGSNFLENISKMKFK